MLHVINYLKKKMFCIDILLFKLVLYYIHIGFFNVYTDS